MNTDIVPFGKYKGQPIESLAADRGYCDWLMAQDWFASRFPAIRTVIINNFAEPAETPEHNALQAKFLDGGWVSRFVVAYLGGWEALINRRLELVEEWLRDTRNRLEVLDKEGKLPYEGGTIEDTRRKLEGKFKSYERIQKDPRFTPTVTRIEFELRGADVVLCIEDRVMCVSDIYIECKPTIGDDYPAVMRQVKSFRTDYGGTPNTALLIGEGGYTGRGATLDQVRQIFKSSGITVVTLDEIPSS